MDENGDLGIPLGIEASASSLLIIFPIVIILVRFGSELYGQMLKIWAAAVSDEKMCGYHQVTR